MSFAWIAALFTPEEIGPSVDGDPRVDRRPEADLAALLTGRTPSWHTFPWDPSEEVSDAGLGQLETALQWSASNDNLEALVSHLRQSGPQSDVYRLAALTIAACPLLAERDLYTEVFDLISSALDALTGDDPLLGLTRAALLQQRSLRKRDVGYKFLEDSVEALRILRAAQAGGSDWALGQHSGSTQEAVVDRILGSLLNSVWSLIPTMIDPEEDGDPPPAEWERVFSWTRDELRVRSDEADQYGRWLSDQYNVQLQRAGVTTIGRRDPDLFYQSYRFELLGHQAVYASRKNLAMMRILAAMPRLSRPDLADCIRLLRHSGAENELTMLLNRLVQGGPLDALAVDARQVIGMRAPMAALRPVDMFVLRAGADLLAQEEAYHALEYVRTTLENGGPSVGAGRYQVQSKRCETAWMAAVALAEVCGATSDLASRLLTAVKETLGTDELWALTFARVVSRIQWNLVSESVISQWADFAASYVGPRSEAIKAIEQALDLVVSEPFVIDPTMPLREIARVLNHADPDGRPASMSDVAVMFDRTKEALKGIRDAAVNGNYRSGTTSPIAIAAHLLPHLAGDLDDQWAFLLQFLSDPRIPRADRTLGFEILARLEPRISETITVQYAPSVQACIETHDVPFVASDVSLTPYPASLRFAFAHNMITGEQAFLYVVRLLAIGIPQATEEAAKSLSSFSDSSCDSWLQSLAIQLSLDPNPSVRSEVLHALIAISSKATDTQDLATSRLVSLLSDDGIAVPLNTLCAVLKMETIPVRVLDVARAMQSTHVSKRIRDAAARVAMIQTG
jgi:hypothetical protein